MGESIVCIGTVPKSRVTRPCEQRWLRDERSGNRDAPADSAECRHVCGPPQTHGHVWSPCVNIPGRRANCRLVQIDAIGPVAPEGLEGQGGTVPGTGLQIKKEEYTLTLCDGRPERAKWSTGTGSQVQAGEVKVQAQVQVGAGIGARPNMGSWTCDVK